MAILPIRIWGDPVLSKRAQAVDRVTAEERQLIADMIETMEAADGAGLAAPQVGVSKRIFVFRRGEETLALINPKIIKREGGRKVGSEGCLSIPGAQGKVARYAKVTVAGRNQRGKPVEFECEDGEDHGRAATCVQHELDHLDGVMYVDKVEPDTLGWLVESEDDNGEEVVLLEDASVEEVRSALKAKRLPPGVHVPEMLRERVEN